MCDGPFDGSAERGYLCVAFFVGLAGFSSVWFLLGCYHSRAVVTLVADSAAGVLYDLGGGRVVECLVVVGLNRSGGPRLGY